jgi:ADP-heptose:LPS heptosyltransferase
VQRILVIRGGAIGDFILTLPALKLLRENYPGAHIEILGHKQIIALAANRYYADASRSIDYAPLARFFARDAELPADLVEYFSSFALIISYLFDPDEIFATNLRRGGAQRLIVGSPKLTEEEHAASQLARPLTGLGLHLTDPSAFLFPNAEDRNAALDLLQGMQLPVIAIHPGSGSETKNWAIENWTALGNRLLSEKSLIVVSGEADDAQTAHLRSLWKDRPVRFATNLPLPHLAALLENAIFLGHDSGISHLAAAAGARCILLFGPTDPAIWAPKNENVRIIRAPSGAMEDIPPIEIQETLAGLCHSERSRGICH